MTCAWPYRDGSSRSATVADVPMGTVDFDGIRKEVCLAYLPEAAVGDYTIVHVGFAISLVDEASAMETLAMFRELGVLDGELEGAAPAEVGSAAPAVNP